MQTRTPDNPTVRAEQLAGEILRQAATSLLLNMRFLESALFRLQPQAQETTFATDGTRLLYGFDFLFQLYRKDPAELNRGYLHTLLHCIFRHPFVSGMINRELWDAACDIAVEAAIEEMDLRALQTARGRGLAPLLQQFRNEGLRLTAEKLYHHFQTHPEDAEQALKAAAAFQFCDHSPWYADSSKEGEGSDEQTSAEQKPQDSGSPPQENPHADGSPEESEDDPLEGPQENPDGVPQQGSGRSASGETGSAGALQKQQALADQWENISRHVQMALETFGRQPGVEAGGLVQDLRALNRERYDYRTFLRRFAELHEVMKVNDDEFDYIFYTYGLDLYGNVPLIEPLEYKEDRRIREFAIVIDTSGSTAGDLVQTFLQKTYNILNSTETFASRIKLRIIQCDVIVQESVLVTSQDEFDAYIKNFRIKGQGGTDFRPAFAHVNELVQSGELSRLKGLIYFTDGYGVYPKKKPDYDAAFVFVRQNDYDEPPAVPPWAIKLVLDEEDVAAI